MDWLPVLLWLHIIGAAVLLGTGAGIAYFMLMAQRTRNPALVAHVAATVVVADTLFTLPAVIAQPVTGYLLMRQTGLTALEGWVAVALGLYVLTGLFWLPVVWIQIRLRDLAREAVISGQPLPAQFNRLYRIWFACGCPAFAAVLAIVWLMVARPHLQLY